MGGPGCRFLIAFFALGGVFSKKNNAFPNGVNIRVLEHLGAPDVAFLQRFQSVDFASKHAPKRYVYNVLAIFCFPKRGHFGKKNMAFLIRFGLDRKSLRCYVYRHFSDFEVSKNAFLFVFARRRFWTFFFILIGKCASNSHTYAKWDPPFKIELPKKE